MSRIRYENGAKRCQHGEPERFLRSLIGHDGDDCVLWPFCLNDSGYGLASIGGRQKQASRWMCILVYGDPPFPKAESAHSCGNRKCVNPNHLRWDTPKGNCADKLKHGTLNCGERNGKTTLTDEEVDLIRKTPRKRNQLKHLAERFGMSRESLVKIRNGKRWVHHKAGSDHAA